MRTMLQGQHGQKCKIQPEQEAKANIAGFVAKVVEHLQALSSNCSTAKKKYLQCPMLAMTA
jgi:hypothetical protein